MKKFIAVLVLFIAFTTATYAQNVRNGGDGREQSGPRVLSPEARAEKQTAKMAKRLNLTDAQQQAVYEANLRKAKDVQPMINEHMKQRHQKRAIQEAYEASLRQTLTTDQYAQYEAMKAERKARRMEHMRRMDGGDREYQPARDDMPSR